MAANSFRDIELDADQKMWLLSAIEMIQKSMDERFVNATPHCQRYGLMMDFMNVSLALTRNFKQEFKCRQELCSQAVDKLRMAADRVVQMEAVAQEWKDSLSCINNQSSDQRAGSPGDKVVRTERDVEMISCQIDRAKDLLNSLSEYQRRWSDQVASLENR